MADFSGEVFFFNQIARNEQGKILHPNTDMLAQAVMHCAEEVSELQVAEDALTRRFAMSESIDESLSAVAEVADAALDLIYVSFNVLYALGIRPRPLWSAIHKANMAKIPSCGSCSGTGVVGPGEDDCPACDGLGWKEPLRNEHGKILKPAGWKPADLVPLLLEQVKEQQ
jgi:predicted HAD superfamily Cof-like phosphohydrolase